MIHLDVRNIHKSFGGQSVLRGLSFAAQAGEHIGIIGDNGAGKTTLIRVITGEELPDVVPEPYGVSFPRGLRVGLVSQLPVYADGTLVSEVIREAAKAFAGADAFLESLEVDIRRMAGGLALTALLEKPVMTLSGGEQTRVNLARLLLEQPDMLLLDEPTNHLDIRACEWLENRLASFRGTVLAVSHDRYFLDHFARRIIEVSDGVCLSYPGNYSFYVTESEHRRLEEARKYEKEQRAYEKLSNAAHQMRDWAGKNAKLHRRAADMEKRAARILKTQKPKHKRELKQGFSETDLLADDVFRIKGLSKSYGDRVILGDITLTMRNGERIALLGENGAGKSTFLKILVGELLPDSGTVWRGPAVRSGYLPQQVTFDRPERTVLDTLLYGIKGITTAEARNRLGAFEFRGEKVFDPVSALSGGERSRLKLCMLMAHGVNLLILDEPTNHLDIDSRAWVENALDDFDGCIFFVTHDRYFAEQFAQRVWWLENGKIDNFDGNFGSFTKRSAKPDTPKKDKAENLSPLTQKRKADAAIARLEKDIAATETLISECEQKLAAASDDYVLLGELLPELDRLQKQRDEQYAEYDALICGEVD